MEEVKPEFNLLKRDGKFVFVMDTSEIHREETVKEEYVKQHYKELLQQKDAMLNNLSQMSKEMERFETEKDEELERFIELANRAANYKKFMDARSNHSSILKMLEQINDSIKIIENTMPELKRMKK